MLFSTVGSAEHSSDHHDRSLAASSSTATAPAVAVPLPRHLLVSLAGITADVTALQSRCADVPQLHGALAAIVGRLDGLVDTIYGCAADGSSVSSSVGLEGLPGCPTSDVIVEQERRQP